MPLLKCGRIVEDTWIYAGDQTYIPENDDIIVNLERLTNDFDALAARPGKLGVFLENNQDAEALAAYVDSLDLIALVFPAFTDGRAYSQARIITTQLGFLGELRATGNVLADQGVFMSNCGFDAFEIDKRQPPHLWIRIANSMSLAYQRGYRVRTGTAARNVVSARFDKIAAG